MTEEEARKKWCPAYRVSSGGYQDNRKDVGRCLASGCMAWRWYVFAKGGWCGLAGEPK